MAASRTLSSLYSAFPASLDQDSPANGQISRCPGEGSLNSFLAFATYLRGFSVNIG